MNSLFSGNDAVQFHSGTDTVAGQFDITGPVLLTGGTARISDSLAPANNSLIIDGTSIEFTTPQTFSVLHLRSGTITGAGDLTVTNAFVFSAGFLEGTGRQWFTHHELDHREQRFHSFRFR